MTLQSRLGLKTKPLFLIDGHAFIYRGFYAYPDFRRADGFPTSAMYIVFRIMVKILREEQPGHIAFITDGRGPTFRHELFADYKAQRPAMPEGLSVQLEPLKQGLRLLGITVLEAENCEADDYIASLVQRFKEQQSVVIVGTDKDLLQCLDTNVVMWDPSQTQEKIVTLDSFTQDSGLTPAQWPDYQAMVGDAADNIPGIPRVGPKTAMKFLRRFPTLDALQENFERLTAKEQTLLAPHMDQAFLYRQLTTLRTDQCPDMDLSQLTLDPVDLSAAIQFLQDFEFRSLVKDLHTLVSHDAAKATAEDPAAHDLSIGQPQNTIIVEDLPSFKDQDIGLYPRDNNWVVGTDQAEFLFQGSLAKLEQALAGARVFVFSYKNFLETQDLDLSTRAEIFDVELAAYLLSPEERNYSLERITQGLEEDISVHPDNPGLLVLAVGRILYERLNGSKLLGLMRDLEMPLTRVLVAMQQRGIRIDRQKFSEFLTQVQNELQALTTAIYDQAGQEFNIRSSQQLGEILFEHMAIPSRKKTPKGAPSTASAVLEELKDQHPIIGHVLEFRMYEKLRSTYLDPLPQLADAQDRLHTTFNQLATATGRLSSSNPNLQNIPIRGPLGGRMRSCFVAGPGALLVAADYSQIELRVLAHMSADPNLLEAFAHGEDIHVRTAALLFDTDQVQAEERRKAKTINFGLLYGMGPQKLGRELGITLQEAKEFIAVYFEKLSRVREFYEEIEEKAKALGYVTTLAGRRRILPGINSRNANLAQQARRMAINTVVQGSAADIIKMAMLAVDKSSIMRDLGAELVLQIHDELLLEVHAEHAHEAGQALAELMAAVYPLSVPLVVDWGVGRNWDEAH